jgi:hypothetical protein
LLLRHNTIFCVPLVPKKRDKWYKEIMVFYFFLHFYFQVEVK